jgi:hypothetical protein
MQNTPKRPARRQYELTFESRPEFLYARVAAPSINRSIKLDYLAEVFLKCAQTRCKQVLLERDIPAMLADEELAKTVDDVVRACEDLKIAFVNPHSTIAKQLMRFVSDGKRRGGKFRYFRNREAAERWLLRNRN